MSNVHHTGPNRHARRQVRAPIIHRDKLFGGVETAEEVHARCGFPPGAQCMGCGKPPGVGGITMRTFMSVKDLKQRDPDGFGLVCEMYPDKVAAMLVPMMGSDGQPVPYVRCTTTYACRFCAPAAERAAAHGPSYAIVDITRGPQPDKHQSGYSESSAWNAVQYEVAKQNAAAVENAVANVAHGEAPRHDGLAPRRGML